VKFSTIIQILKKFVNGRLNFRFRDNDIQKEQAGVPPWGIRAAWWSCGRVFDEYGQWRALHGNGNASIL